MRDKSVHSELVYGPEPEFGKPDISSSVSFQLAVTGDPLLCPAFFDCVHRDIVARRGFPRCDSNGGFCYTFMVGFCA